MFRKMLLGALAAGGLLAGTAGMTEAAPYYHRHPAHVSVVRHREFCSMGEARAWVGHHRVSDVRFEWHGGHVWVFYR